MTFHSKPDFHRYGLKGRRGDAHHNSKKTHCPHGHEYTPENTRMDRGSRACKMCQRIGHHKKKVSYRRGPYKPRRSIGEQQCSQCGKKNCKAPRHPGGDRS